VPGQLLGGRDEVRGFSVATQAKEKNLKKPKPGLQLDGGIRKMSRMGNFSIIISRN